MTNYFIEAILVWSDSDPSSDIQNWFVRQGLKVTPMQKGLLISGDQSVFEKAFQMGSLQPERPLSLPVPDEWSGEVLSITIPRPKRF